MKKFIVLIVVVLVLVFANLTFGQDCGKCPHKKSCSSATEKTEKPAVQKEDVQLPMVYTNNTDKIYHLENCTLVKDQPGFTAITLAQAVDTGLTPCTECKPPIKVQKEQEPVKEEKKN